MDFEHIPIFQAKIPVSGYKTLNVDKVIQGTALLDTPKSKISNRFNLQSSIVKAELMKSTYKHGL
jgi:hypothetical protein